MVTLKPVGDVELWYIQAENGEWRLPLHVEWKVNQETGQVYGLVLPGVCFYEIQLVNVNALLGRYTIDNDIKWLIPKNELHALLHKAPGINAAFYYNWPSGVHPAIPAPTYPQTISNPKMPAKMKLEQYRTFAEFVSKECNLPSDVVVVVLTAVGRLATRWMVDHRQVLDLGFCKLVALPFRANWKEIVTYKLKPFIQKSGRGLMEILKMPKKFRDNMLERIGLPKILSSQHNTGLRLMGDKEKYRLNYTIEAITTKGFEKEVNEIENERMKSNHSYVSHYELAVETHYETIIAALKKYLEKISAPWGSVRVSRITGALSFFPLLRSLARVKRGAHLDEIPVHITPPDTRFSVYAEDAKASDPQLLYTETTPMRQVPAISQTSNDMRKPPINGHVGQSRDD